jgi:hypothetical protein
MAELETYKTNMINRLTIVYNKNRVTIQEYYAVYTIRVLKSRLSSYTKIRLIISLAANCVSDLSNLEEKFNSDVSKIEEFIPPLININKSRKALMIGMNYIGTTYQLQGCLNDVENISTKLTSSYGFLNANIIKITDNTVTKPRRVDILSGFKNLLVNSVKGDLLFFYFSGHGGYVIDRNGDELDGYDERIYTSDMKTITDDELKQLIVKYLKKDVTLFVMFDSCYSGTMLDLKYQYLDSSNYNHYTENDKNLETSGNVFMISGCTDDQLSAEKYINPKYQGAMSWAFLLTLNSKPNCTWRELLINMRSLLVADSFVQIPQLSTGRIEDIDKRVFLHTTPSLL